MMINMYRRLIFCLMLVYLPSVYAVDVQTRLQKSLEELKSFSADFSQRVIDVEQTKVQPSTGSMSFKRPGKFIWSYSKPYEQDIISDGKQIWIYDKDLEQVTVRSVNNDQSQTPMKILDNPADIQLDYQVELLSENGNEAEIQLTPNDRDAAFKYVILIFNKNDLIAMEIYDSFDHYNSLTFNNLNREASLDDELFTFVTPPGVDVINAAE